MPAERRKSHPATCPGPAESWSSASGRVWLEFCEGCNGFAIKVDGRRVAARDGIPDFEDLREQFAADAAEAAKSVPSVPAGELRLLAAAMSGG